MEDLVSDTTNTPDPLAVAPNEQAQNLLTQEQVNRIVAREKAKAAESAKRQVEERYQQERLQSQSAPMDGQASNKDMDANAIYQQVQEKFNQEQDRLRQEMQDRQLKEQMTQVANSYLEKVELGKKNYQDFDEVTKDFDPTAFPQVTYLLSGIENAGDILYDLSKNPMKLSSLSWLAEKNPKQAHSELLKLSKSITDNRQAQEDAQNQGVSEPLDRLKSSRVAGSNGEMGIRDLRNQPWLRG